MKNNANSPILFIGSIFIILGSILVIIGFNLMLNAYRFKTEAVSVKGVIVNIGVERYISGSETRTRNIVSVDYIINGVKYENTVNEYRSSMRIGDEITLYYQPDTPWVVTARLNNNTSIGAFFTGIGGIFLIVGIIFFNSVRKKRALQKYLKQYGIPIYAQVIDVEKDYSITVSYKGAGGYPYSFLKCAVMEPGSNENKVIYNSWSIKNNYLHSYIGKKVKVYIHPQDNNKYYVDIEDLIGK